MNHDVTHGSLTRSFIRRVTKATGALAPRLEMPCLQPTVKSSSFEHRGNPHLMLCPLRCDAGAGPSAQTVSRAVQNPSLISSITF